MGPGHHSFVQEPKTGQWFIVYHRWQNANGGHPLRAKGRSIAIEPIRYGPTGEILPIIMTDDFVPLLQLPTPLTGLHEKNHSTIPRVPFFARRLLN
jgi:hypothetical protein